MKRFVFCMILSSLLLIPSIAFSYPFTATIDDNDNDDSKNAFWGGKVTGPDKNGYLNQDVIGSGFEVENMVITKWDDNDWTVVLTGPYFTNYQNTGHLANRYGPGDLYINSNGWQSNGESAPHYVGDTFLLGEGWNYVITQKNGSWGLYNLTDNPLGYSDTDGGSGTYRDNQAWRGGGVEWIGNASYLLSGSTLTFTFNTGSFNWTDSIGFHWTMKCGNDVVEGMISTPTPPTEAPEPSTLLLLGLGLSGIAIYKKYRK